MDDLLLALIDNLAQEIMNQEAYETLKKLKRTIENDPKLSLLVETFCETKDAYEKARRYGKSHPDFHANAQAFQQAKITLFENPVIQTYKSQESVVQQQLEAIAKQLANIISLDMPHRESQFITSGGQHKTCLKEKV